MKKVVRRLRNLESCRLLNDYLVTHFETKKFPVRVTLERYEKKRSNPQNATIHMWFGEFAEQIGDSPADVKRDIKELLSPKVEGPLGVMRPKGTSEMTVPEMKDFMEAMQALAINYDVELTPL